MSPIGSEPAAWTAFFQRQDEVQAIISTQNPIHLDETSLPGEQIRAAALSAQDPVPVAAILGEE